MSQSSEESISIQLGDILNIIAPDNSHLNNKIFLVDYIDKNKIIISSNEDPQNRISLKLDENGQFQDTTIEGIEILSRSEFPGYAKQNNLLPGVWVNIYFGGEIPFIIVGRISDLEEDTIELTSYPENKVIYIDFAYQGIPEDLQIEKIEIRQSPVGSLEPSETKLIAEGEEIDQEKQVDEHENIKQLKTLYLDADQINFGQDLEDIIETIDVSEDKRRYGIEKQVADLLDDLLSEVPHYKRTPSVENTIHLIIERFKQLRQIYSVFDENGNISIPDAKTDSYKPIIKNILQFNKQFSWLIPVSVNKKNIYDLTPDILETIDVDAINPLDIFPILEQEDEIIKMYRDGAFSEDENKYKYLFRSLNKYFSPFTNPNNIENLLHSQRVNTHIASIVNNIDNLSALVASNDEGFTQKKKFYFDYYTRGLSYLKDKKPSALTPADNIVIQSFITLPISTLLYSFVNLPSTDIFIKSQISMLNPNYWQIFNNKREISQIEIIENFESHNNSKLFLNGITQYILNENLQGEDRAYERFLDSIISNNANLFNLVKKFIKNKYSIYSIVKYLELFLIYYDDITDDFYRLLNRYVNDQIKFYKERYSRNKSKYEKLYTNPNKSQKILAEKLINIIKKDKEIEQIIFDAYELTDHQFVSDAELITHIFFVDSGRLFFSALIKLDFDLQTSNLVDNFIKSYEEFIAERRNESNQCKILVKKYNNLNELESDNYKQINVDKELNLTGKDKFVGNGEYAVLILPIIIGENPSAQYYLRENDIWRRDETLDNNVVIKDNKLFCNIQENCLSDKNSCSTINNNKYNIDEDTLRIILSEFDSTFGAKEGQILEQINKDILINAERIKLLKKLELEKFLFYNNQKRDLGNTILDDDLDYDISKYEKIRDIILGQTDIRKKQFDIQRFAVNFTREAYADEDPYWLYSKINNSKLLPTFLSYLANVYLSEGDYLYELDLICTKQGTISDDGDKWVDKHSGYIIKDIDFNTEEGFTVDGFKLKTRELLEEDLGNAVLENGNKRNLQDSPETKKIKNLIRTLVRELAINLSNQEEFIIRNVLNVYETLKPNEDEYNKRRDIVIKRGKKNIPTFVETINISYSVLTLVFLLVAIQTSIPPVNSKKSFPGCKKSFSGYPFEGQDKTALAYIACAAYKLTGNNEEPWISLKKIRESGIIKRMEQFIGDHVLTNSEIKELVLQRHEYEKQNKRGEKLVEIDAKKLINFLPPLQAFKLKQLEPLSPGFVKRLIQYFNIGSVLQDDNILLIRSKIFFFSLSLQEKIQKIISKMPPILTTYGGEPYLQNACCEQRTSLTVPINVLKYFVDKDTGILNNNNYVFELSQLNSYVRSLAAAPILFDPIDTKLRFASILPGFSKETIYRAFIHYCKLKSVILDDSLQKICETINPNLTINEQIISKIDEIEKEGIYYDEKALQKLLDIVNTHNEVNVNLYSNVVSTVENLRNILDEIDDSNSPYIPSRFIGHFKEILDTYSISLDKNTLEMRSFKDYLYEHNKLTIMKIEEFIKINVDETPQRLKGVLDCFREIDKKDNSYKLLVGRFVEIDEDTNINRLDENLYREIQFIQNSIRDMIETFPQIILNQVNYSDVNIPKHWNVSQRHTADLKNIISEYYRSLNTFYGDKDLTEIFNNIYIISKTLDTLTKNTIFYAYYGKDNNEIYSVFDRRLTTALFDFYFLKILENYILLIDKTGILLKNLPAIDESEDLEEQVDAGASVEASVENLIEEQHDITATGIDVVDKKILSRKLANYLYVIIKKICNNKSNLNYNSKSINDAVQKSREKEKDTITDHLKGLTDEEREIENLFKNSKLERWSKGLQKGITQYVQKTYDEEREDLDQQAIKEKELGQNSDVTDRNRNIYQLDFENEGDIAESIDAEVFDLTSYPNEAGNDDEGVDDSERDYENDIGTDYGYITYEGYEGAD